MKIAIVGGTGKEGHGIALRWLKAGHALRIGSRDPKKAVAKADELRALVGGDVDVVGLDNAGAVRDAQVVLLSVPYAGHAEIVRGLQHELAGKIVIDITVPLQPPHVRRVFVPESKAAALETQAITEGRARVVAALHHVSSVHLAAEHAIDCNVLVCSDDEGALQITLALMTDLHLRGIHAGPLANSVALESLTPVLLHINKHYKNPGVGIRITGL
jgi:8-hydroxy-5-deazaflavin:NADPH oxidoreductase